MLQVRKLESPYVPGQHFKKGRSGGYDHRPKKRFAWYPVQLENGKKIFLEHYWSIKRESTSALSGRRYEWVMKYDDAEMMVINLTGELWSRNDS